MRYGCLLVLATGWLLTGATCFPLIGLDEGSLSTSPTNTLAISVTRPEVDREVPLGAVVEIEWTAANLAEAEAVATVLVRKRDDFTQTILSGGLRLPSASGLRTLTWDTSDFQGGAYSIVVRVEAGEVSEESIAPGRVTINTPPSFEFTEPSEDSELTEPDPNDPNAVDGVATVDIRWSSFDPDGDGQAQIGIDPDLDHESENEIIIAERDVSRGGGFDSLKWDGTDKSGERVEGGTYNLFALVFDGVNDERIIDGPARITVSQEPNEVALAITQPEEDTEFLTTDDPLTIEFTLDEADDVLIDLKVDPDDNHRNGNESTILAQRLVEEGTHEDSFEWDGDDTACDPVDDGIYRIILVMNRGSGSPTIIESEALVFRRSEEDRPLIGLLKPDRDETVDPGDFVLISWRDDDPGESATVRLTLDDDETPNEAVETDGDEMEILADREADGDGVRDTFQYQVPLDLAPDRYSIFAYIDADGDAPFDHISIGAGHIVVEDPEGG